MAHPTGVLGKRDCGGGGGPTTPFHDRPAKMPRKFAQTAWVVSHPRVHLNYAYSYSSYYETNCMWSCYARDATFITAPIAERGVFFLGLQEIGFHEGGQRKWGEVGECDACGVMWCRQQ